MGTPGDKLVKAVTFDLETRKLAQDLEGGWDALRRGEGGISCLVAWAQDRPHLFDGSTLDQAAHLLESTDVVLSFNGQGFDQPVLEGVLGRSLHFQNHVDLLQLIWAATSSRVGNKMTDVAQRTLGVEKNGNGLLAPKLAETGQWATLFDYCLHDVWITRELFKFAQTHGGVIGLDGELLKLDLPDWFGQVSI